MPRARRRHATVQEALEAALPAAMRDLSLHLDARFTEEISAVKWDYPTPPQVRDIVDTGRLRASQTRHINEDGSFSFTWPVEYAAQVHEGGVDLQGRRFPGRPWTEAPSAEIPQVFGQLLAEAVRREDR